MPTRNISIRKHGAGMYGLGLLCAGAMLAVTVQAAFAAPLAARPILGQKAGQSPAEMQAKAAALMNQARSQEAVARRKEAAGRGEEASAAFTEASSLYVDAGVAYGSASGDLRRAGKIAQADALRLKYKAAFAANDRDQKLAEAAHTREMAVIEGGGTPPDAAYFAPKQRPAAPRPAAPPSRVSSRPRTTGRRAPAPPTPDAPLAQAGGPPAGTYYTLTLGYNFMANPSALGDLVLRPDGTYRALGGAGRYSYDPATTRVHWLTGPLQKAVAYLKHDDQGKPRISFPRQENEHAIDGHVIDMSDTSAYLKGAS